MAGIYIHIPFCKKACHYCNFHFSTTTYYRDEMLEAINKELVLQQSYLHNQTIHTIYFGGGTPSILPAGAIQTLLQTIREHYNVAPSPEITLEANPDDLLPGKLQELFDAGINRLSIGVQSFFEDDLQWMNRAHNADQALRCLQDAQRIGFSNISIDLIYGGPTLTDEAWKQNVHQAFALNIPHLSCYALTVEPGTALDHFINKKKIPAIDPDKAAKHFEMLMNWVEEAGYEHYEISNYAKPGMHSQHNSSYWKGMPYLGVGPSAHSYDGNSRQWNVANNQLYMQSIRQDTVPAEVETLSPAMKFNEYMMISLRTSRGTDLAYISEHFGEALRLDIETGSKPFITKGWMTTDGHFLRLTKEGKFFADGIAAEFFMED
ncbi:oxygen-independent coproporphyrinogen-3 oxidase [Chitinophaga skermanii]|uniref:Heme chaperone HemW n=1 Tax=Chitinophaga skermanii TaxID=331697 RepID=A0A327QH02_9BACT|nr:radical SAM family heme chaperone HemW [Chitinophaga skermanii]RAJ03896.1 oxygen-independent coproporphyrinogen-3 oxidase [Chitinophaga skermanii]